MRFEILELVEQYGSICSRCVCESAGASHSELKNKLNADGHLEFVPGNCGRCHSHSTNLICAKRTLASRLKKIAEVAGVAVLIGPAVPILALGAAATSLLLTPEMRDKETRDKVMASIRASYRKGKPSDEGNSIGRPAGHGCPSNVPLTTRDSKPHVTEPVTAEWLDAERRSLIRTLNAIDHEHRRDELLGKRIQRLRNSGKLPPDVANAMRQVTLLRNKAVYDEYVLLPRDRVRLELARDSIRNWSSIVGLN